MAPGHEAPDRLGVALHQRFDRAVSKIAHPAMHAQFECGLHRGVAISNTLHATANREVLRLQVYWTPTLTAFAAHKGALVSLSTKPGPSE